MTPTQTPTTHRLAGTLVVLLGAAPLLASSPIERTDRPIAGQYLVMLDDEVARAARSGNGAGVAQVAADLAGFYGGSVGRHFTSALAGFVFRGNAAAAEALARDARVARVAEDGWAEVAAVQTPIPSWGLDRIDQRPATLDSQYAYNADGEGIDLYVVDTGVRSTHQDFGGRVDTVDAFTAIADANGTEDCNGHGTHVAGVAGSATYGVAKGVTIHPVRVLDCSGLGPVSNIIAGVDWITAHYTAGEPTRAVVNFSIKASFSFALEAAVANSIAAGVTYVVAAGNDGADACYLTPGRLPAAITVGASDATGTRWASSNLGTCVDLFAPGTAIQSTYHRNDADSAPMTGTSAAAPHVAGTVALMLAADPELTPDEIQAQLLAEATVDAILDPGAGSPNLLLYSAFVEGGLQTSPGLLADGFEAGSFAAWSSAVPQY